MADETDPAGREPTRWLRQVGWLVVIWVGSVAALGAAAGLLKCLMRAAGLQG